MGFGNHHKSGQAPLDIDKVKSLPIRSWLWIDVLTTPKQRGPVSGYFRVQADYTKGEALCAGYPGITHEFEYVSYGRTWVAYMYQPEEEETSESKNL